MPAKQKYLSSTWKRVSKVTAAIVGSYILTMLIHVVTAKVVTDETPVIMTTAYSSFLMWVGFMVLAFFIRKAWHVWGIYALLSGICLVIFLV